MLRINFGIFNHYLLEYFPTDSTDSTDFSDFLCIQTLRFIKSTELISSLLRFNLQHNKSFFASNEHLFYHK